MQKINFKTNKHGDMFVTINKTVFKISQPGNNIFFLKKDDFILVPRISILILIDMLLDVLRRACFRYVHID